MASEILLQTCVVQLCIVVGKCVLWLLTVCVVVGSVVVLVTFVTGSVIKRFVVVLVAL